MSALLCCRRRREMGAALSQHQDGPTTMAELIRERKKKAGVGGLGSLRRRLAAARRGKDRGCEHARYIRGVVASWRPADVVALYEELEAGSALRDLVTQAELAREPAPSLQADLLRVYRDRWCCDIELVLCGETYPAHRALLAARSPHLRALLHDHPRSARLHLEGESGAALEAVYGEGGGGGREWGLQAGTLLRDVRYLLESGEYADARLVFWREGSGTAEFPCHRVVLGARSRYFRSVLGRSGVGECGTVCVDEKVLPRRFARALLHAAYTDRVDLTLIGPGAGSGRLEDAFRLYEIARFLEMPIAAQGCEDAIVEGLSGAALPAVLRWSGAPHASHWVRRQAMRRLRDDLPTLAPDVPRAALREALASPFLQASESQALRALMRWGERHSQDRPNVVWHTGGVGGGGSRQKRKDAGDAALRETVGPLVGLVRLEHLTGESEVLQQAVRRGVVSGAPDGGGGGPDAWLGRGHYRPCRVFLPYLDEIKALLEERPVSRSGRSRRARCPHRIPDALYMVRGGGEGEAEGPGEGEGACLPPRVLLSLRERVRELRASPPTTRALSLPAADTGQMMSQLCLRAVRELCLPDACADLLREELGDPGPATTPGPVTTPAPAADGHDCCRQPSTSSGLRSAGPGAGARLPDVALAPNANTHLLTARDYCTAGARVLQLDLGDGATHGPRPGSRAARQQGPGPGEEDLRAAIELSVIRAYSSYLGPRSSPPAPAGVHGARPLRCNTPNPARGTPSPSNSGHLASACRLTPDRSVHVGGSNGHASDRSVHVSRSNGHTLDRSAHLSDRSVHVGGSNGHTLDRSAHLSDRSVYVGASNGHTLDRSAHLSDRSVHVGASNGHTLDRSAHLSDRSVHVGGSNGHTLDRSAHLSDRSMHVSGSNGHTLDRSAHLSDRSLHLADRSVHVSGSNSHTLERNGHLSDRSVHVSGSNGHTLDRSVHVSGSNGHTLERNGHLSDRSVHVSGSNGHTLERNGHLGDRSIHLGDRSVHISGSNGHTLDRNGHVSDRSVHLGDRSIHLGDRSVHISGSNGHTLDRNGHVSDRSVHLGERSMHISGSNGHPLDRNGHVSDRSVHLGDRSVHVGASNGHMLDRSGHIGDRSVHIGGSNSHTLDRSGHINDRSMHLGDRSGHASDRSVHVSTWSSYTMDRSHSPGPSPRHLRRPDYHSYGSDNYA